MFCRELDRDIVDYYEWFILIDESCIEVAWVGILTADRKSRPSNDSSRDIPTRHPEPVHPQFGSRTSNSSCIPPRLPSSWQR